MKSMDKPMTQGDFKQLTLLANAMAVIKMSMAYGGLNQQRKAEYAEVMKRLKRLESSIPGYLAPEVSLDQSKLFYDRMGTAVQKFIDSFNPAQPVGRDAKGRFTKL